MSGKSFLVLAIAVMGCGGPSYAQPAPAPAQTPVAVSYSQLSHTSMPPRRIGDCITYTLLDDKCTADWYKCTDTVKGKCVRAWADCCTLPGNPARTTIVSAPQTP